MPLILAKHSNPLCLHCTGDCLWSRMTYVGTMKPKESSSSSYLGETFSLAGYKLVGTLLQAAFLCLGKADFSVSCPGTSWCTAVHFLKYKCRAHLGLLQTLDTPVRD
jgi:hypothetical protein